MVQIRSTFEMARISPFVSGTGDSSTGVAISPCREPTYGGRCSINLLCWVIVRFGINACNLLFEGPYSSKFDRLHRIYTYVVVVVVLTLTL